MEWIANATEWLKGISHTHTRTFAHLHEARRRTLEKWKSEMTESNVSRKDVEIYVFCHLRWKNYITIAAKLLFCCIRFFIGNDGFGAAAAAASVTSADLALCFCVEVCARDFHFKSLKINTDSLWCVHEVKVKKSLWCFGSDGKCGCEKKTDSNTHKRACSLSIQRNQYLTLNHIDTDRLHVKKRMPGTASREEKKQTSIRISFTINQHKM